jgi:glycosyltransferase involved in cell wall biosynthesis
VIPTRGESRFFDDALDSALRERPREVVVVADGGPFAAGRADAGVRRIVLEPVGRSAARNAGVEAAQTPFVAFVDDDDVVLPGRLGRQRDVLERWADAPLTFGRVRVVDAGGRPLEAWNELLAGRFNRIPAAGVDAAGALATRAPIYTSATLVRREVFLSIGGYDVGLEAHEDLDLYLRLARLGPVVPTTGEAVAAYRLHGANTSSDRLYEGILAVTAKHLPEASGRLRRLLLERRVEALWGLGRRGEARREALRAARVDPRLLAHPRFARRLAGALVPTRLAPPR